MSQKVKISNYSSTLTIPAVQYNVNQRWKFTTEDGVLIRFTTLTLLNFTK